MKYLILLILVTQTIFSEHVLFQVKRRGQLDYLNSSNGFKKTIASKVSKFKIKYPWIAYRDVKGVLFVENLVEGESKSFGPVDQFQLGEELLAYSNSSKKLYSYHLKKKIKIFHSSHIQKFKTSGKALLWLDQNSSLQYYSVESQQTQLIDVNIDFFQVSWPMLSYADMGYQLHGMNLERNEKRRILTSFYQFQVSKAGLLTLDRNYKMRFYNEKLKRVQVSRKIERVRDFKFIDHYILYRQYDTKNLMFRNLRAPNAVLKSFRPKAYQLAPHTLTIINREGSLEIENRDYDQLKVLHHPRVKTKYRRLLTGNSVVAYTIKNKVFLYNAKIGKEYSLGSKLHWMELEGMSQMRPMKSLQEQNFKSLYSK
ncbi:hypothetical protein MJH12_17855 [bacterium]|nr:hypothetical protein [bacterium]